MMAANYQHSGGLENRLGRHYSRFSASGPAATLAAQSLVRRKSRNGRSNRRSWASSQRVALRHFGRRPVSLTPMAEGRGRLAPSWRFNHRFGLKTSKSALPSPQLHAADALTGSSHWLRLAGKQETGFTFSQ